MAAITVRDYGPGVPDHLLGAIFEPFVRVEGDRSRTSGGVGLGLASLAEPSTCIEERSAHKRSTPAFSCVSSFQGPWRLRRQQGSLPSSQRRLIEQRRLLLSEQPHLPKLRSGPVRFDGQPWLTHRLLVLRGELRIIIDIDGERLHGHLCLAAEVTLHRRRCGQSDICDIPA